MQPSLSDPFFLLLLPLPWLLRRFLPMTHSDEDHMIVPPSLGARLATLEHVRGKSRINPGFVLWVLLILALTGPRILESRAALPISGRDIVLAIDLSGSMVTADFQLDGQPARRIDAVKAVAKEFVRNRAGDRLALILFGSRAYFATPQTYDVEAVAHAIDTATIGISGRATGISDALGLALKRLAQNPDQAGSKVIILLSDGVNNVGAVRPRDAAGLARDLGIVVHTIALGTQTLDEAKTGQSGVDTATLRAIAEISGGTAFRVRDTDDLQSVVHAIDELENQADQGPATEIYRPLWVWPAMLAMVLALWLVFGPKWGRR